MPSGTTGSNVMVTIQAGAASRFATVNVTSGGLTCPKSVSLTTRDCTPPRPSGFAAVGIFPYASIIFSSGNSIRCI